MDIFTLRTFTHVYVTGGSSRSRVVVCQWLKTAMFNFDLSIFHFRYNEVHCHSLKLYPFLSSKMIMVSQNLGYCSRKVTHFLKYPTVTVKIIHTYIHPHIHACIHTYIHTYTLFLLEIYRVAVELISSRK